MAELRRRGSGRPDAAPGVRSVLELTGDRSAGGSWAIDPKQSSARFSLAYAFVATLNGNFGAVEGDLVLDEDDASRSSAHASIDVRTIRTGISLRDAHLKSSQFFHVSKYPRMAFRSTRIEHAGENAWHVIGELTVRDVTCEVTLDTTFHGLLRSNDDARRAKFTAKALLNRREFGLGRHGPGGIVSDDVHVTLDIVAKAAV